MPLGISLINEVLLLKKLVRDAFCTSTLPRPVLKQPNVLSKSCLPNMFEMNTLVPPTPKLWFSESMEDGNLWLWQQIWELPLLPMLEIHNANQQIKVYEKKNLLTSFGPKFARLVWPQKLLAFSLPLALHHNC